MQDSTLAQTLVFDLYGTLVDTGSVTAECERAFPGRGKAVSDTWRAKQLQYTWLLNSMGEYLDFGEVTRRALTFACRSEGLRSGAGTVSSLTEAYLDLEPFEDALPAARDLIDRGATLFVLSNGTFQMVQKVLERAGLLCLFSGILSVDSIGVYKPDPRVYGMAADHLGTPPAALGFVSANSWDIAGAASFGLKTVWVNRSGAVAEEIGAGACVEVASLTDLPPLLQDDERQQ